MSEPTCAVWYYRHGSVYYSLCADEDGAVRFAYSMNDSGDGAVEGVQFADGRYMTHGDWPALDAYEKRLWDEMREAARRNPTPTRPTRSVPLPWDPTKAVKVMADAPAWLGATVSR